MRGSELDHLRHFGGHEFCGHEGEAGIPHGPHRAYGEAARLEEAPQ